ncbi:MAG: ribosome small subunit-dependent GTPase A [Planctomycetota bacterium]|jgi:ribosome biogenesis GTPase
MAKGKGKSKRRLKGWDQRLQDGDIHDAVLQQQSLVGRGVKIPTHRLEAQEENLEDLPKVEGMVMGFFPGGAIVRVEGRELLCGIAKAFRAPEGSSPLAVGDLATVALTQHADGQMHTDRDRTDGVLIARQLRETLLARPQPISGKKQDTYKSESFRKVIAANMDTLLIVSSMRQPRLRRGVIDRFAIIAERGDLHPLVAVNKIDLARPDDELLDDLAATGLDLLLCSAKTGEGLEELGARLTAHKSVLAGASGVGKSALINALIPGANALTRTVRTKDKRGRHTTTAAMVYDLPCGGMIVDTPGIRELSMELTAEELAWYFPEFEPHIANCRFNNCTHTHEPDCAVHEAVEAGDIDPRRFESYLRILETL